MRNCLIRDYKFSQILITLADKITNMKLHLLLLLFISILSACANEPKTSEAVASSTDSTKFPKRINRLDGSSVGADSLTNIITELARAAKVTGAAVTIFNNNEVVYQKQSL
jgi:hypothetical protein